MIHGIDTGFLVALELSEHPEHAAASALVSQFIRAGDQLALAPQVLAEFVHIVTDARRFLLPLPLPDAINLAEQWWTARDVIQVFPDDAATRQFLAWLKKHSLGRKRLLDTLLAATYWRAGIPSLLTTNAADFGVFGCFTCLTLPTTP